MLSTGLFFTIFLESSRRFLGGPWADRWGPPGGPLSLRVRGLWAGAAAQANPKFAAAAAAGGGGAAAAAAAPAAARGAPQTGVRTPRQQQQLATQGKGPPIIGAP